MLLVLWSMACSCRWFADRSL